MPDPSETQFCFVIGCQRSGTTALTRLLHSHPAVVIGMERYKTLLSTGPEETFGPALFEPERFLDFRPGDTNITPDNHRFKGHYRKAQDRFRRGSVRYVGDKVAATPAIASAIAERFPSPRVVFIYRDLLRVASSFVVRANNPNDPWRATHEAALHRWTKAFGVADQLTEALGWEKVFAVRYERLFSDDPYLFRALFDYLDLPINRRLHDSYRKSTSNWEAVSAKPLAIDAEQQAFLLDRQDRSLIERFDERIGEQFTMHLKRPSKR